MDTSDPFQLFPYRAIVDHPPIAWPNGAKVAVWVIPNIEHFHWEIGNPAPDVRNHSRRDYGNRVGVWRVIEVMEKNGGARHRRAQRGSGKILSPRHGGMRAARLGADGPRTDELGDAQRSRQGQGSG